MGHDLRFALRTILAHRWFSLAIVATLALGIGLNTMVFTLVYAVMYKPVPVPAGSRLVIVAGRNAQSNRLSTSYPNFLDYQGQSTAFEALEAGRQMGGVISEAGNPPRSYDLCQVSGGLFDMLHVHPILGRSFRASDAQSEIGRASCRDIGEIRVDALRRGLDIDVC